MDSRKNYFDISDTIRHKLEDFQYELPQELIAQYPLKDRDSCRLMVLDRESGEISHKKFTDLVDLLKPQDCLVLNDTRVFPARLFGQKDRTGAQVEVFLLRNLEGNMWEVMVKPARKIRIGNKIVFSDNLSCDVVDNTLSGGRIVEFNSNGNILQILDNIGYMPLPPYIKRMPEELDQEYYQTVYADKPGAVAAPTAGLHFTDELLNKIGKKGITITRVTLHVGLGTFRPVKVDDISRHKMDSEYYEVDSETAQAINKSRKEGKSVVAVGTTCVRALETLTDHHGFIRAGKGWTDKFIYPPYEFRIVDKLLTNFHLPGSTLLMLVSAFSSLELTKEAYNQAMKEKYRFFSYGDAMFIR
ncbi:MAG: tRNA preQ1(34) S-adenosylmethionine ribosyltransferase-isomerase QueA [Calditrichaeota bacterium]|nr:tRNA preQ1(34) S-adenosylmethionine ribosyltransferase-isomerase QueA [Calditrichota bacterium]RQW03237.1 MAG: tRNA preQ1(34) S-adenosylmethionine ribosyltransferase-isomerase QueA [Calditrichota bacterium]